MTRRGMVEGGPPRTHRAAATPSTTAFDGGPPPHEWGGLMYHPPHCRVSSLPTIIRMIWFVPSRIEWTRRSRQNRSTG